MSKIHASRTIQVAVGLIVRDKKILVNSRPPHKSYSDHWEFPGGKIEKNESSFLALKRECFEELNISVRNANFLLTHAHQYPDKKVLLDVWEVVLFDGEPCEKENQKLKWVLFEELVNLPLLEANLAFLDQINPCA